MTTVYTFDKWVETFKPTLNPRNNWGGDYSAYETYGEDLEYVSQQDVHNVWTEVDIDNGTTILAGFWRVNRIQYFVTTEPWTDENTEVPTWAYRECDCRKVVTDGILDYLDDYDPACEECNEGTIDIPCDTVEDLKQIYGEGVEIVG